MGVWQLTQETILLGRRWLGMNMSRESGENMRARAVHALLLISLANLATGLSVGAVAAADLPKIAVIPISENAPPGMAAAQVAAERVVGLLNKQGRLNVTDSASVASAVRRASEQTENDVVDWREVASELDLDLVALVTVVDVHIDYLGEQMDHLAVGEGVDKPGTVHVYEAKALVRLQVVDVNSGKTLLDAEGKGNQIERYRQSYDASKYAEIIGAVRDLAAIFDDSVQTQPTTDLNDNFTSLSLLALERASSKLSDPLSDAFPIRGIVILVTGSELTIDVGSDAGVRKGMKFDVLRPGQVIVHPTTGEEIATGEESIGTAKVSKVSTNTAVLHADRRVSKAVEVGYVVKTAT